MSKRQLIEQIQQFNATASAEFLDQFNESALQQYLERLQDAQQRKPHIASWSRPARKRRMVG
ncbi:MAG: hypothetical protein ABR964_00795 [Tepidisphaeraceae bacterium]|jgi:transposase-like protein